ncbi:hypothetical protein EYS42_15420 [Aquabacterium lacunae]|uniref:PEP-CTERM sorting domain-containing protein n=1 Tax=Aquabacterium lacunae TaxID=2528630 RepID=A0A4Q9H1P5_9BURK|nr:hypothetical protein [Aquabacterium lacunae]TBO28391.1 hypothetical protein EYS42_15420 [Aquabacterium lacunae]
MKNRFTQLSIVLAAFLPALATASAEEPVLAAASAQLLGLQYRLVDLDPNDGIDPSITFASNNEAYLMVDQSFGRTINRSKARFTPLLPADGEKSVGDYGDMAVYNSEGLSAFANVKASEAVQLYPERYPVASADGRATIVSRGYPKGYLSMNPAPVQTWTMSPHTALIVEGRALLSATNDAETLLPSTNTQQVQVGSGGRVMLSLGVEWGDPDLDVVFARSTSGIGLIDESFSLRLDNAEGSVMKGLLGFEVTASAGVGIRTLAGVVPEPSQWALYLMGLALMPLAVAHQRKKQRTNG